MKRKPKTKIKQSKIFTGRWLSFYKKKNGPLIALYVSYCDEKYIRKIARLLINSKEASMVMFDADNGKTYSLKGK